VALARDLLTKGQSEDGFCTFGSRDAMNIACEDYDDMTP